MLQRSRVLPARLASSVRVTARRNASSEASPSSSSTLRNSVGTVAAVASGIAIAAYYFDSRAAIHRYVIPPLLRVALDPEQAHKFAVAALASGVAPRDLHPDDARLATEIWGHKLSNPISLAAGFDKHGEAIEGLFGLGFSWVEIGSVTPKPQPGNPQPRVFNLPEDSATINRYGFPSVGFPLVLSRLRSFLSLKRDSYSSQILAVNLGKNKSSPPDSLTDYIVGVRTLGPLADVLVINVSSPNTPGLRGLQSRGMLVELLTEVTKERNLLSPRTVGLQGAKWERPKLVVKIAPDLSEGELEDVAEAVRESGVDGVVVSNTTIQRPSSLISENSKETGGLSGPPLLPLSISALRTLRTLLPASIPLFGCGGISSGADALAFAKSGASAVQLYTAFGYGGAGVPRRIKDELAHELEKEGTTWAEVVQSSLVELAGSKRAEAIPADRREEVFAEEADELRREAEELKSILEKIGSSEDVKDDIERAILELGESTDGSSMEQARLDVEREGEVIIAALTSAEATDRSQVPPLVPSASTDGTSPVDVEPPHAEPSEGHSSAKWPARQV